MVRRDSALFWFSSLIIAKSFDISPVIRSSAESISEGGTRFWFNEESGAISSAYAGFRKINMRKMSTDHRFILIHLLIRR
jgi:hypothetical protein